MKNDIKQYCIIFMDKFGGNYSGIQCIYGPFTYDEATKLLNESVENFNRGSLYLLHNPPLDTLSSEPMFQIRHWEGKTDHGK